MEPLLTLAEVAHALACSRRSVSRLIASGLLPVVECRGLRRVRRADLERLIAESVRDANDGGRS